MFEIRDDLFNGVMVVEVEPVGDDYYVQIVHMATEHYDGEDFYCLRHFMALSAEQALALRSRIKKAGEINLEHWELRENGACYPVAFEEYFPGIKWTPQPATFA